jgi:hypothetical protein
MPATISFSSIARRVVGGLTTSKQRPTVAKSNDSAMHKYANGKEERVNAQSLAQQPNRRKKKGGQSQSQTLCPKINKIES